MSNGPIWDEIIENLRKVGHDDGTHGQELIHSGEKPEMRKQEIEELQNWEILTNFGELLFCI